MITFLLQTATGFSRLYITTAWGKKINAVFGGYDTSLLIHKWVGVVMMVGFVIHTVYLLTRIDWRTPVKSIFGPDSLVPNLADLKQFGQRVLWFFGLGSHPRFDRWTYWEKFDYWAVYWGLPLLAITGVMLMYPHGDQPVFAGVVAEYCRLAAPGGGYFGRDVYFYRSFFYRAPQAFQFSHERGDVFGQRSLGRSDRGKTGLGGKPAKLRQTGVR